jgi:hypothetical protein
MLVCLYPLLPCCPVGFVGPDRVRDTHCARVQGSHLFVTQGNAVSLSSRKSFEGECTSRLFISYSHPS